MSTVDRPISTKLARVGVTLSVVGGVTAGLGLLGLGWWVVTHVVGHQFRTADELGRAAAIPHICTVLGTGLLIFGYVLRQKAKSLREERNL